MKIKLIVFVLFLFPAQILAQKSQLLVAQNSLGKLNMSINNKEDYKKQFVIIGEGIKAIELAQADNKTKNWPETWAIKAYLSSYIAITDNNETNADKYYNTAVEALEQAIKRDKYQTNANLIKSATYNINIKKLALGNKAYQDNEFSTAFYYLKQVSDYFPTDTTLAINTAMCAQNIQLYNEALNYFKRAKENKIKNPVVFQLIANIYASKFESDLAIQTLEDGLYLNPNHNFLTNDYINLLLDNEKYDKAKKAIETSIIHNNQNKLLYYLLGYLNQTKDKNNFAAEQAYQKALKIDENYFDALYQLSLIFITNANNALIEKKYTLYQSNINRAEFILLQANEINTNDKNTVQLLIEIYNRKNRLDKVQELKRKINEF